MSVENKKQSGTMMIYKGRLVKVGVLVFFSLLLMVIYVNFFQHPPVDEMLANNRQSQLSSQRHDFGASLFGDDDLTYEDKVTDDKDDNGDDEDDDIDKEDKEEEDNNEDEDEDEEEEKEDGSDDDGSDKISARNGKIVLAHRPSNTESDSESKNKKKAKDDIISHKKRELGSSNEIEMADYWEKFLKQQNLVPIGAVYNKCEGHRMQIGTVVLMEDKENGGIMARTYVNMTLDYTVDGGQFNIDSRYNGRSLYDNYWDLCEVEDDIPEEERTYKCPLKPGKYTRVKDKPIPGFLPKGRYQSKTWATDQNGQIIGCGYSDFTI